MPLKKLSKEDIESFENHLKNRLKKFKNEDLIWLTFKLCFERTSDTSSEDIQIFLEYLEKTKSFDNLRDNIGNKIFGYAQDSPETLVVFNHLKFQEYYTSLIDFIPLKLFDEFYNDDRLLTLTVNNLDLNQDLIFPKITNQHAHLPPHHDYLLRIKDLNFTSKKIKLISMLYALIFLEKSTVLELEQYLNRMKIDFFLEIKDHDLNTYLVQPAFQKWLYYYLLDKKYIKNPNHLTSDSKKQLRVIFYTLDHLYIKNKYNTNNTESNTYHILIKRIKKNWQQKNTRNQGSPHQKPFNKITNSSQKKLAELAKAYGTNEDDVLKNLIEEAYKKDIKN